MDFDQLELKSYLWLIKAFVGENFWKVFPRGQHTKTMVQRDSRVLLKLAVNLVMCMTLQQGICFQTIDRNKDLAQYGNVGVPGVPRWDEEAIGESVASVSVEKHTAPWLVEILGLQMTLEDNSQYALEAACTYSTSYVYAMNGRVREMGQSSPLTPRSPWVSPICQTLSYFTLLWAFCLFVLFLGFLFVYFGFLFCLVFGVFFFFCCYCLLWVFWGDCCYCSYCNYTLFFF